MYDKKIWILDASGDGDRETFGCDGHVRYLDHHDSFPGAHICQIYQIVYSQPVHFTMCQF